MNEPKGKTMRVKYIGEERLTRGDLGERVDYGHLDADENVWVWDATFGWQFEGQFEGDEDPNWRIE